tara:strand:- start:28389 stop:30554 length:2166 start_codon:yes stop_codon:yes gene_type:complete
MAREATGFETRPEQRYRKTLVTLVLALSFVVAACGGSPQAKIPSQLGRVDAPYELAADDDLYEVRAAFEAIEIESPLRPAKRAALATEYRRRIAVALRQGERETGFEHFEALLTLWRPSELPTAHDDSTFVALVPVAESIRKTFAKSGGDIEASAALFAKARMQPQREAAHLADIDEIFRYGDELATLEHGPGAVHSRPIAILERALRVIPTSLVVDKLIALYLERQIAIKSAFRRDSSDTHQILSVHGPGVLTTTHNVVRALAVSHRLDEAEASIAAIIGIGDDAKLRKRVEAAMTSTSPTAWLLLSASFRETLEDEQAALAICLEAISRYPKAPMSYVCAGETAEALGNPLLAIRFFQNALSLAPKQRVASEALAALYEQRVSELAFSDRPNAALKQLKAFELLHKQAAKRKTPLQPDLASAYLAMARGLVSLGELDDAHRYLARSLQLRPNLSAYEFLGTIALHQEQFSDAQKHFANALALPETTLNDLFQRAQLRRLSAEALEGKSGAEAGQIQRELAFADWLTILSKYELSADGEAEARLEIGKLIFLLGKDEEAMSEFLAALGNTPNDSDHADIVAFLLGNNRYQLAKDIYLDALGHHELGQYYKIYMSLWILAEAKHLALEPDYHATNYLQSLEGKLWSVRLAKFALGEGDLPALEARATTRGRRAELLYYRAVLGPESKSPELVKQLLEEVVRGSMVLFFEYDMAKRRLREQR